MYNLFLAIKSYFILLLLLLLYYVYTSVNEKRFALLNMQVINLHYKIPYSL
jgi:hypothetical protein